LIEKLGFMGEYCDEVPILRGGRRIMVKTLSDKRVGKMILPHAKARGIKA